MSIKNLYVSEKDKKHQSKIVVLQGDDIYFKEVKGNRKNFFESKMKNTFTLDEIERKMRYKDICKQYELFFNIKLKKYNTDYLEGITKLLALNEKDYIKKRKELINKRKKTFSPLKTATNFLKKKEKENLEMKKMSQTTANFNFPKIDSNINTNNNTNININTNLNTEDNNQNNENKFLIVDSDLPEPPIFLSPSKQRTNIEDNNSGNKEMRFFVNKITKKRGSYINIEENEEIKQKMEEEKLHLEEENHIKDRKKFHKIFKLDVDDNEEQNKKKKDVNTFNKTHYYSNNVSSYLDGKNSFFDSKEIQKIYNGRNHNIVPFKYARKPNSLKKVIPNSFIGDFLKGHKNFW